MALCMSRMGTTQKYICISRPRRFGKSITANMLAAYYECEQDSKELFSKLKISASENFEKHLNQYDTIFLNMQEFLSQTKNIEEMIELIKKSVIWDLLDKYGMDMREVKSWYDGYSFEKAPSVYSPRSVVTGIIFSTEIRKLLKIIMMPE